MRHAGRAAQGAEAWASCERGGQRCIWRARGAGALPHLHNVRLQGGTAGRLRAPDGRGVAGGHVCRGHRAHARAAVPVATGGRDAVRAEMVGEADGAEVEGACMRGLPRHVVMRKQQPQHASSVRRVLHGYLSTSSCQPHCCVSRTPTCKRWASPDPVTEAVLRPNTPAALNNWPMQCMGCELGVARQRCTCGTPCGHAWGWWADVGACGGPCTARQATLQH